ncbi:von Willebrand factor-like [Zophobas morio]|uniref:von Willebrand factor-like n=1 Tax=Zophobas morio TaxID=2755281 RepID=UPI003082877B
MNCSLLIIFAVLLSSGQINGEVQCPPNEKPGCESACAPTCQNKSPPDVCTEQCVNSCICIKGYIREGPGGKCVPEACEGVPICKEHEQFTTCRHLCPEICNQTEIVYCILLCRGSGCNCAEGYVRTKDGDCIPNTYCRLNCEKNAVYNACGTACPPTCTEPQKTCGKQCVRGCFCKKNYVIDDNTGRCIKKVNCPKC